MSFGILDYWRMFKNMDLRLPFFYFINCHLFDIKRSTDTHFWVPNSKENIKNFKHGIFYMPSWTSEIIYCFRTLENKLLGDFFNYQFIDLGCGKGKPCLVYSERYKSKFIFKPIGIDYSNKLIEIAKSNALKSLKSQKRSPVFINDQAESLMNYIDSSKLIVYLYNPFDSKILRSLIKYLNKIECFVFYVNPVHLDEFLSENWLIIEQKQGWHPACTSTLLTKKY